jgi:hypothetical protein
LRVSLQAPEVEHDARFVADDPRVVPGRHVKGLARSEVTLGPIVHAKRHSALEYVADVLNLARVGPGDRLDVLRPPLPGLEGTAANGVSVEIDKLDATLTVGELPNLIGLSNRLPARSAMGLLLLFGCPSQRTLGRAPPSARLP